MLSENTLYIIIIFLLLIIICLMYLICNKKQEDFTVSDEVKAAINEVYQADIDAMRNLANISSYIMKNNDTLILPANITNATNMNLSGNLTMNGNLTIDGNVKFTNKNSNIMEIFPRYMVISWASDTIPKGWALCNGDRYILDNNGDAQLSIALNAIKTPDLRGRFVLGSGQGANLTNRTLDNSGGSENHTLTLDETPSHSHFTHYLGKTSATRLGNVWGDNIEVAYETTIINNNSPSFGAVLNNSDSANYAMQSAAQQTANVGLTNSVGKNLPHNNMPPYYVLTYIMKL